MDDQKPMLDVQERVIKEHRYKVVLFPAARGFDLLYRLNEVLGDSFGSLFGGNMESALTKIGGGMSRPELLQFVLDLLEWTYVDGATEGVDLVFFNQHFSGRYGQLLKVLAFVVEVNFSDFFDECKTGMIGLLEEFRNMMKKAGATNVDDVLKSRLPSNAGGSSTG